MEFWIKLGDRLMVGRRPLKASILVRVQVSQLCTELQFRPREVKSRGTTLQDRSATA